MEEAVYSPTMDMLFPGTDRMKERPSYEELITPVRERMMRVIWRIVRHPEEAEDTMQEVLTTTWKKRNRIFRHPNPQALILKICVNAAVDALRKKHRGGHFVGSEVIDRLPDGTSENEPAQIEMTALVKKAVCRLPKKQAVAVAMRILEGHSYKEIAEALGCREATARTHVFRGRHKLARWLSYLRPSGQEEVIR